MDSGRRRFVRNAQDKSQGKRFSFRKAVLCAGGGMRHAFITQRNMKIHLAGALVAIALGCVFAIRPAEWAAVSLCIAVVFAFECMNTALESVVDLVSPDYSVLAKNAKDCAAGAVAFCALGSLAVAAFIFIPPIVALFGV